MKKLLFLLSAGIFSLFPPAVAQTEQDAGAVYLSCDFGTGIPQGFSTFDRDGQTLHFSMVQVGFEQGDSWTVLREANTKPANYYAASTSKHKVAAGETAQPADDWLITPPVYIRAADAKLSWRACSFCEQGKKGDSYRVLVSVAGRTPEDFTGEPLFFIESESINKWTWHEIPLGEYAGKEVRIAFVNATTGGEILGIDDLKVEGGKGLCDLTMRTLPYVYGQEAFRLEATVGAYSDEPVTRFTASYRYGGQTRQKTFEGLNIRKGETFDFAFDELLPAAYGDTLRYDVWVEANGQRAADTLRLSAVSLSFNPKRRVVVEEGTGMWCTYCPKGIVAMRELREKYPDSFIGIALHYEDPMEADDYVKHLQFPCFPSGFFNRKYFSEDPMVLVQEDGKPVYTAQEGGFETLFLAVAGEQAIADVALEVHLEGQTVVAEAVARYALPLRDADVRLAFVVTEDNVQHEDYYQINHFSGGEAAIGGFEKMPSRIQPFTFDEVARAIHGGWQGIAGSQPAQLLPGTPYRYGCSFKLPAGVDDLRQVRIIALLIDQRSGEILNADSRPLAPAPEGIAGVAGGLRGFSCHMAEGVAEVSVEAAGAVEFAVHDLRGAQLFRGQAEAEQGRAILRLPRLPQGVYLVTVAQGHSCATHKIRVE